MRVLDLFSGIGAMSLGLEWAGMRTVGFCEIEPACRHWLREHWPTEPIFEDIRTLTGDQIRERCGAVDLVAGGFPCQDISAAGKGAGLSGARSGLWFDMLRIVRELRPDWVLAENVGALRTRGADEVLKGLGAEGYACWPLVVGADDAGAPQRRKRVWIVAHTARHGQPEQPARERADRERVGASGDEGLADTYCSGSDRLRLSGLSSSASGNGQCAQRGHDADGRGQRSVGDTVGAGLALGVGVGGDARAERAPAERAGAARVDDAEDESSRRRADDARQPDTARPGDPTLVRGVVARPGERQHEWEAPRLANADTEGREGAEPGEQVAGLEMLDAGSGRKDAGQPQSEVGLATARAARRLARLESARRRARLRALGNSVYPQTVAAIGRAIMKVSML